MVQALCTLRVCFCCTAEAPISAPPSARLSQYLRLSHASTSVTNARGDTAGFKTQSCKYEKKAAFARTFVLVWQKRVALMYHVTGAIQLCHCN